MNPSKCRSCGALVRWVTTLAGKKMPVDIDTSKYGNIVLRPDGTCEILSSAAAIVARSRSGRLHLSHFVTCPHGPSWRKRP